MNTTPLTDTRAYAAAVREALADLPADDVDELTEGLEADLAESWQENGGQPLSDPASYAKELRQAAGLPDAVPTGTALSRANRAISTRLSALAVSIRQSPAGAAMLDFFVSLRPAWWVLRGYLAYQLFALPVLGSWALLPTSFLGGIFALALIGGSVWLGLRSWGRIMRGVITAGNLFAVFALFLVGGSLNQQLLAQQADPSDTTYGDPDPVGLYLGGTQVTNLFAYDANGTLIPQVQLFDQDGNPVIASEEGESGCLEWVQSPETANWDGDCPTAGVWVPSKLETGAPAWNVFPQLMTEESDTQGGKPKEGAVPVVAKPPFVKVPALDLTKAAPPANQDPKTTE